MLLVLQLVMEFDGISVLPRFNLSDHFVSTACEDGRVLITVRFGDLHMSKVDALVREWLPIHQLRLTTLRVQLPEAHVLVIPGRYES